MAHSNFKSTSRGWLAEAFREQARTADKLYDEAVWSYRNRPASRTKRLKALQRTRDAANLHYAWTQGSLKDVKVN